MIPKILLNEKDNKKQSSQDVKTALQIEGGKKSSVDEELVKNPEDDKGEDETKHIIASGDNDDMEDTDIDNLIHRS